MDLDFLKKVKLFQNLTEQELITFSSKLKLIKVKENEIIIKDGELGDKLYILYKGKVGISKKITMLDEEEDRDKTFIVLSAKDCLFFGEIGLLESQKRTATVTANSDCELYTLTHKDFMHICKANPRIGFRVNMEIALKLSHLVEKTNSDVLKLTTALIYALR
ncbi:MAG: cyclic nucleotide-binding domain-containing protein [Armatimonadetes bacterium]|nr:cyclic nucleotide-binding domain-containing protein [Armatimonadota bacterium]